MPKIHRKKSLLFLVLGIVLVFSFLFSLMYGGSELGFRDTVYAILHPHLGGTAQIIIWQLRLPRILLGLFVGAGLACCGAVFQALLRNPLAESYTLGVSGGAALGATLGIILMLPAIYLPIFAFSGSFLSIFLVYSIASKKRFSNPILILGGVILNFLFSSLVLLIFAVSKSEQVHAAILWLMGDLSSTPSVLIVSAPFLILPAIGLLLIFARELNILTLGEEKAQHLGINVESTKKLFFLLASVITGVCIASAGIIGFVGLIVPHFMRKFTGADHRLLLPAASIAGATFLILSDTLARIIIRPMELPVGVITGIFGGIFFLSFLLKSKHWELF